MSTVTLINRKPRETGGASAYRAFDFQVHTSMARILEVHRQGVSFRAYFDHFDDLVLVQSENEKPAISFYQVKARTSTAWTSKRLAARPSKGEMPKSIIGKAYFNLHEFGVMARKAAIVSNQHLQAKYPDGTHTTPEESEILLSALSDDDRQSLVDALKLDFPAGIDPRHIDVLVFERIPLDIQSFRQTLQGLITEFVDAIGPDYAATAKPVYEALLSEISRCTGTVSYPSTIAELERQKSLGNTEIDALIERVKQRSKTPVEWWPIVAEELSGNGWRAIACYRLRLACQEYWNARRIGTGHALHLSETIRTMISEQAGLINDSILQSIVAFELFRTLPESVGQPYTTRAAIVVEVMESIK